MDIDLIGPDINAIDQGGQKGTLSGSIFRDQRGLFDADPEIAGRQRCPYAAKFRAERTVAGAGRNFGRIRQPVQLEGDVAAVAAAADQYEFRSLRCPNSLVD